MTIGCFFRGRIHPEAKERAHEEALQRTSKAGMRIEPQHEDLYSSRLALDKPMDCDTSNPTFHRKSGEV